MPRPKLLISVVGLLALALQIVSRPGSAEAFTPAEGKAPMTVTLVRSDAKDCGADCPEWLALTGVINAGTPALFAATLGRLGHRRVPLLVDSPGGAVEAAIAMGKAIRARGLDVAVAGTALTDCVATDRACAARRRGGERPGFTSGGIAACASACVLLLAAGTDRAVGPNSYVGVHQMVIHKTLTRVINTFRITRRLIDGHPVEVSRRLIATRPVSSRVIQSAAPQQFYSEVDRYLLGLGVAESIMPLMRSAPPSGIHWMTPGELASTRIANDTTEVATLLARAATPASPSPGHMALAAVTRADGHRWMGIVDWRVDRSSASPTLLGTVDVPERRLHGTVKIRRVTTPGATDGFMVDTDFGSAMPARAEVRPPQICLGADCSQLSEPAVGEGGSARRFGVTRSSGDMFLATLQGRSWMTIGVTGSDGDHDTVDLSLLDAAHRGVNEWARLCCGASALEPAPTEAPPLPDGVPVPAPAVPVAATTPATAASSDDSIGYVLQQAPPDAPSPTEGIATLTWTTLPQTGATQGQGKASLLGSVEVKAAGLRLSLEIGLAPAGGMGGVAFGVSTVPNVNRFGPVTDLTVSPIWTPDSHIAVLAAVYQGRYGGTYDVTLASAADIPLGATLDLEFLDRSGRRLTVAIPVDGALADLLKAARSPSG